MTRNELYNKIKHDALAMAEEDLRTIRWSEIYGTGGKKKGSDTQVLNPDWHPYYMRINGTGAGMRFSLVVRDGEYEYFRQKKQGIPDFRTPAMYALQRTLAKYQAELTALYLTDIFNKTDGVEAKWLT